MRVVGVTIAYCYTPKGIVGFGGVIKDAVLVVNELKFDNGYPGE